MTFSGRPSIDASTSGGPRTAERTARLPEVDRLKGFAILCVVCIHAGLGEGAALFEYVVNRAVPLFLVTFGMTSESWWLRRRARRLLDWYAARLDRLLPPVVAVGASWCIAATAWGRLPTGHRASKIAAALVGYVPWAGTTWFVVVVLQLVIAFPLAHRLYRRIGAAPYLVGAALLSSWCVLHVWDVVAAGSRVLGDDVPQPAWYYAWIFAPRVSWPVAAGMFLATAPGRSRSPILAACLGLLLIEPIVIRFIGEGAEVAFTGPLRKQVVMQLLDVPLAVLLLGVFRRARLPALPGSLLERAGRASWGIYLGHALIFEMVHLSGRAPELTDVPYRACYAVLLLGMGALAAWAGARLREALVASVRAVRGPVRSASAQGRRP